MKGTAVKNDDNIVKQVRCDNDECGMVSAYRCYADGSFRKILEACGHPKRMPTREQVRQELLRRQVAEAEAWEFGRSVK